MREGAARTHPHDAGDLTDLVVRLPHIAVGLHTAGHHRDGGTQRRRPVSDDLVAGDHEIRASCAQLGLRSSPEEPGPCRANRLHEQASSRSNNPRPDLRRSDASRTPGDNGDTSRCSQNVRAPMADRLLTARIASAPIAPHPARLLGRPSGMATRSSIGSPSLSTHSCTRTRELPSTRPYGVAATIEVTSVPDDERRGGPTRERRPRAPWAPPWPTPRPAPRPGSPRGTQPPTRRASSAR